MADDSRSWIGSLAGRTGLPALLAIVMGTSSFIAGLPEPMVLANRKLMLGVTLCLAGLLYHAGLNWRFRSDSTGWIRACFSIESLAVLWWATILAFIVWLAFWPDLTATLAKRGIRS
jgi:hypothetical protein